MTFSLQRSRWGPAFSDTECVIVTVVDLHINNLLDILKQNEMSPQPDRSRIKERFPVLSDREAEVLALLSWGLPARAIGTKLFISPRTVEAHIRSIYAKLDVRTKAEAIALASSRRDSGGVLVSLP
ncbi:MAG TPA: helix-turn-helix transcriptional regulator [Spirochaetia bacterium]